MANKSKSREIKSWAEWFERRAKYYDNALLKVAYYIDGQPISDTVIAAIISDVWEKLRAGNECSMLDIGAGVGLFTRVFTERLKYIVTTDISPAMAKDGRRMNPGADFLVCEANYLPFASSSFDRLLCYSVFHYFKDLAYAERALGEFLRVVKNEGLILIGDVPRHTVRNCPLEGAPKKEIRQKVHYPASLKHNLKQMNFEPEFFTKFCKNRGLNCNILAQNIDGKPTISSRFDVLIEAAK